MDKLLDLQLFDKNTLLFLFFLLTLIQDDKENLVQVDFVLFEDFEVE